MSIFKNDIGSIFSIKNVIFYKLEDTSSSVVMVNESKFMLLNVCPKVIVFSFRTNKVYGMYRSDIEFAKQIL